MFVKAFLCLISISLVPAFQVLCFPLRFWGKGIFHQHCKDYQLMHTVPPARSGSAKVKYWLLAHYRRFQHLLSLLSCGKRELGSNARLGMYIAVGSQEASPPRAVRSWSSAWLDEILWHHRFCQPLLSFASSNNRIFSQWERRVTFVQAALLKRYSGWSKKLEERVLVSSHSEIIHVIRPHI